MAFPLLTTRPVPQKAKGNRILVCKDVAIILCHSRGGNFSVVADASDVPLLSLYTWHVSWAKENPRNIYAQTVVSRGGKLTTIRMHKLLADGEKVDHANGRGTDNRRANLRPATGSQNNANMRGDGFKGVSANHGKFNARIKHNGRLIHLGRYETREEAARAYDAKAIELFGKFARTNFGVTA